MHYSMQISFIKVESKFGRTSRYRQKDRRTVWDQVIS